MSAVTAFACLVLATSGCGHAETAAGPARSPESSPQNTTTPVQSPATAAPALPDARDALCRPAKTGSLRARLQGAIETEIDWSAPQTPQCLGGPRPTGAGVRLLYKGSVEGQPLLLVIGAALTGKRGTFRNVPANVTIVREGAGEFYATQGDDKCALDEVRVEPETGVPGRYRLSGRGYCTQPARAMSGEPGVVLVSRFDVTALIDNPEER
jgi:hypothetical protein